jgi:hypothetical protein
MLRQYCNKAAWMLAVVLGSSVTVTSASAAILFESGTLGTTGISWQQVLDQTVLGENVNANAFNGV